MKEDEVNECLDQLGILARECQAIRLVEWLAGQEQGNRKPVERRKRHRSDATPRLGGNLRQWEFVSQCLANTPVQYRASTRMAWFPLQTAPTSRIHVSASLVHRTAVCL